MPQMNMFGLVRGFSEVVDMLNNTLCRHHQRVAFIVDGLCERLVLERTARNRMVMAAMLHDVGVIPLHEQTDNLAFETNMEKHSLAGWLFLDTCPVFRTEARIIRYHHTSWRAIQSLPEEERAVATMGNLVHLADVVDVHVRLGSDQAELTRLLRAGAGKAYLSPGVEAALDLFASPGFFEDLGAAADRFTLPDSPELWLSEDNATLFSLLFSHLIDARSPFTATHSSGVAHMAAHLHELMDQPAEDRRAVFIAGLLHDIGKMGVPLDLIEKPGPLTGEEFAAVKRHARLSRQVLSSIPGFERLAPWAADHHEQPSGQGYPEGLREGQLPLESRLLAAADVLTALTEDRPYRPGLKNEHCLGIIDQMVAERALDGDIVALVHDHLEDIVEVRRRAQTLARRFFRKLSDDIQRTVAAV